MVCYTWLARKCLKNNKWRQISTFTCGTNFSGHSFYKHCPKWKIYHWLLSLPQWFCQHFIIFHLNGNIISLEKKCFPQSLYHSYLLTHCKNCSNSNFKQITVCLTMHLPGTQQMTETLCSYQITECKRGVPELHRLQLFYLNAWVHFNQICQREHSTCLKSVSFAMNLYMKALVIHMPVYDQPSLWQVSSNFAKFL